MKQLTITYVPYREVDTGADCSANPIEESVFRITIGGVEYASHKWFGATAFYINQQKLYELGVIIQMIFRII